MEAKDFFKKFFAGLFFIACVVMIAGVVFLLGLEKGIAQPKFPMHLLFNRVGGLQVGAAVRLSGVTVGTVSDISFAEEPVMGRGVRVDINILEKFRKQAVKSVHFSIITEGILGEKMVEITTSPENHREDLSQPVIGEDPLDVQNLAETFGDSAVALLETSKMIESMVGEIQDISGTTRRLLNRIEQRLIDGTLFKVF